MGIEGLLRLCCAGIALLIHEKPIEQVREILTRDIGMPDGKEWPQLPHPLEEQARHEWMTEAANEGLLEDCYSITPCRGLTVCTSRNAWHGFRGRTT